MSENASTSAAAEDAPPARETFASRAVALAEVMLVVVVAWRVEFTVAALAGLILLALHRRDMLRTMFSVRGSWRARVRIALAMTAAIWALTLAFVALLPVIGIPLPDYSVLSGWIEGNPTALPLALRWVWTTVPFGEELLARGFLIDRLEAVLRGIPGALLLAVTASAALFGLAHRYQGPGGMLLTGSIGLVLGWLYIRQGRNLWANVIVHALVDTVAIVLVYFGIAP